MVKNPTVFICDDYNMVNHMANITKDLEKRGVKVIRGPKTTPGTKLRYTEKDYELFKNADVMMFSSRSYCDRKVIDHAPKCKGIVTPSVGFETVDLEYCNEKKIICANGATKENTISVAEATIMYMLMCLKKPWLSEALCEGKIKKPNSSQSWCELVDKKTVGMIGFGRIARYTAERLSSWGCTIKAYSPSVPADQFPEYVQKVDTLAEVLRDADVVGIFVAITPATVDIINRDTIEMMKDGVCLVNTSRGEAVDEEALYDALKSGKISQAWLDVQKIEPMPISNPLRTLDNFHQTLHCAGWTKENYQSIVTAAVGNIMNILRGEMPIYPKNPQIFDEWKELHRDEF